VIVPWGSSKAKPVSSRNGCRDRCGIEVDSFDPPFRMYVSIGYGYHSLRVVCIRLTSPGPLFVLVELIKAGDVYGHVSHHFYLQEKIRVLSQGKTSGLCEYACERVPFVVK